MPPISMAKATPNTTGVQRLPSMERGGSSGQLALPTGDPRKQDKTTSIESRAIRVALAGAASRSILDVGAGIGRFELDLLKRFDRVVALDKDRHALAAIRVLGQDQPRLTCLRADASQLPFSAGEFSAVLMVRVFHRFLEPSRVLREASRVLARGGRLVLFVNPSRTLRMLYLDALASLAGKGGSAVSSFSRGEDIRVSWGDEPGLVSSLRTTERRVAQSGLQIIGRLGVGVEELPGMRRLSVDASWKLDQLLVGPLLPTRVIVADKIG